MTLRMPELRSTPVWIGWGTALCLKGDVKEATSKYQKEMDLAPKLFSQIAPAIEKLNGPSGHSDRTVCRFAG
jgi:hypothetical protein